MTGQVTLLGVELGHECEEFKEFEKLPLGLDAWQVEEAGVIVDGEFVEAAVEENLEVVDGGGGGVGVAD